MKSKLPGKNKAVTSKYESLFAAQIFAPVILIALVVAGVKLPLVLGLFALIALFLLAKKTYI